MKLSVIVAAAFLAIGCVPPIGPEEQAEIVQHAGVLAKCQAEGRAQRDAGSAAVHAAYEACKRDGGIK